MTPSTVHTVACNLQADPCEHLMADIEWCVICAKKIAMPRAHFDTCSLVCFQKLLQRTRVNRI